MTISAAGFGLRIGWEDEEVPPGHKLSFKQSVEIIGTSIFVRLVCPQWLFEWAPTEKIRVARDGFAEFRASLLARCRFGGKLMQRMQSYLAELINERKFSNEKGDKRDLLSNLVDANDEFLDDGKQKLGEDELIGKLSTPRPPGHPFNKPLT